MKLQNPYNNYIDYEKYQEYIHMLLHSLIRNMEKIRFLNKRCRLTTENIAEYFGISMNMASMIKTLYDSWRMGDLDLKIRVHPRRKNI